MSQCGIKHPINVTHGLRSLIVATLDAVSLLSPILIPPWKAQPLALIAVLAAEKCHVQPAVRGHQPLAAARIGRVGMVYFPLFADTFATFDEAAVAWLLALHEVGVALGFEFVGVLEVVFDRRHGGVLSDVEVEVEVCAVGTNLFLFQAVSLLRVLATGTHDGPF